jgi:hypothetical protein
VIECLIYDTISIFRSSHVKKTFDFEQLL